MDDKAYQDYWEKKSTDYETRCARCGSCCGAFEVDPCSQLKISDSGLYFCSVYDDRLGVQKTVAGREFLCVPVRKVLFESWSGSWNCAYKKS